MTGTIVAILSLIQTLLRFDYHFYFILIHEFI